MITAILSDIHANPSALFSVCEQCKENKVDNYWLLGDIFGRGPDPVPVISWVIKSVHFNERSSWIIGNHDALLFDLLPNQIMNQISQSANTIINDHRKQLQISKFGWDFLVEIFIKEKTQPIIIESDNSTHILTHGGIDDFPEYRYSYPWYSNEYFINEFLKITAFYKRKPCIMWFGHTHVPTLISATIINNNYIIENHKVLPNKKYFLDPQKTWLINPGSIGQPRDLDPRSSYALLNQDTLEVSFKRKEYKIENTLDTMNMRNYPKNVIDSFISATAKGIPDSWLSIVNAEK